MAAIIGALLGTIIIRLWLLQIVNGPQLEQAAVQQQLRRIKTAAPRGIIEDRYGHILATSKSQYIIAVTPDDIVHNPHTLPRLAKLLHLNLKLLKNKVKKTLNGPLRYTPLSIDANIDFHTLAMVEEQILQLPGTLVTRQPVRYYTDDTLCTPILGLTRPIDAATLKKMARYGYTGEDSVGIFGLEKSYELNLRGKPGERDVAVDARGRLLRTEGQTSPTPGKTLRLALDFSLQRVAAEALHNTGHPGAAVALNPNTGAVLAMASMPTYNLNTYGQNYSQLVKNQNHPLINRASDSTYPCGSTFKLVTASAALKAGTLNPNVSYFCPGYLVVGKRKFHCDAVHGEIGFYNAIGKSCDVYFYHVAQTVGHTAIANMAHEYGFGWKTGVDIPADASGLVPTTAWKKKHGMGWLPGDTLNMAIGQGYVRVSPLQLADYVSAIANGGTLWTPHLVDSIINPVTGAAHTIQPKVRGKVNIDPQYLQEIIQGMLRVTQPGGTAPNAAIPGFPYAAKTGTAQVYFHGKETDNSVFICFAPVDHPTIAIAVLVERAGYGGIAAAGVARKMLLSYFHLEKNTALQANSAKPSVQHP